MERSQEPGGTWCRGPEPENTSTWVGFPLPPSPDSLELCAGLAPRAGFGRKGAHPGALQIASNTGPHVTFLPDCGKHGSCEGRVAAGNRSASKGRPVPASAPVLPAGAAPRPLCSFRSGSDRWAYASTRVTESEVSGLPGRSASRRDRVRAARPAALLSHGEMPQSLS